MICKSWKKVLLKRRNKIIRIWSWVDLQVWSRSGLVHGWICRSGPGLVWFMDGSAGLVQVWSGSWMGLQV